MTTAAREPGVFSTPNGLPASMSGAQRLPASSRVLEGGARKPARRPHRHPDCHVSSWVHRLPKFSTDKSNRRDKTLQAGLSRRITASQCEYCQDFVIILSGQRLLGLSPGDHDQRRSHGLLRLFPFDRIQERGCVYRCILTALFLHSPHVGAFRRRNFPLPAAYHFGPK